MKTLLIFTQGYIKLLKLVSQYLKSHRVLEYNKTLSIKLQDWLLTKSWGMLIIVIAGYLRIQAIPIVYCAGPDNLDITIIKESLETENPLIAEYILNAILNRNLTTTQIQELDAILNNHLEETNPESIYDVYQGHIQNAGNVPSTPGISYNTIINVTLVVIASVAIGYLLYRNWESLGSLFRDTVETAVVRDPEANLRLARRFASVSNNQRIVREIYLILRQH